MSSQSNPMGTDGYEFIEFAAPDPRCLVSQFEALGFNCVAKHRSKEVFLYRQNNINFILNAEPNSHAARFAQNHGAGACAMAFRVKEAAQALERAVSLGAEPFDEPIGPGEIRIPAIKGIGNGLLYFVDHYRQGSIYDIDFVFHKPEKKPTNMGLTCVDHLTHNVFRGDMDQWADFYERIFNFKEIRFFDIKGEKTGLLSRALESPCGKIKIPLNEATEDESQIEEFIHEFHGEGIQHIALSSNNIYDTVEALSNNGVRFLQVPDTYYDVLDERIPHHRENKARMQKNAILIDGTNEDKSNILLQIFTQNMLGPMFFEIIQRKGNQGFGEGNFQALFEAIERDQKRRGVL